MSLGKYIKKLIRNEYKTFPHQDELQVSGVVIQNDIVAQNDTWVGKSVTGDIYCAKTIIVRKGAEVTGDIKCRKCTIEGKVKGDVSASEMLEIKANAIIEGNIITENLQVEHNAVLYGYVTIIKDGAAINADIKLKTDKISSHQEAIKRAVINKAETVVKEKETQAVANPTETIVNKTETQATINKPEKPNDEPKDDFDQLKLSLKPPQVDTPPPAPVIPKAAPAKNNDDANDKWW